MKRNASPIIEKAWYNARRNSIFKKINLGDISRIRKTLRFASSINIEREKIQIIIFSKEKIKKSRKRICEKKRNRVGYIYTSSEERILLSPLWNNK